MVNLIVNWKTWEAPHSLVWCVKPLIIESEWFRNYQPPTRLVHHRKQSKLIKLSGIYSFALLYSLENFSRSMLISFPKCVPATQHYKLIKRAGPEQFLHKININSFHFNVFYARDFFTRNLHFLRFSRSRSHVTSSDNSRKKNGDWMNYYLIYCNFLGADRVRWLMFR